MKGFPLRAILLVAVLLTPALATPSVVAEDRTTEAQVDDKGNSSDSDLSGSGLSNNNYETNVDGQVVHAPAYSNDGGVPAGATAQCRDGTYSFSQHRSGTCSHHGGVASWL